MERPSVESIFQALAVDIQAEAELFARRSGRKDIPNALRWLYWGQAQQAARTAATLRAYLETRVTTVPTRASNMNAVILAAMEFMESAVGGIPSDVEPPAFDPGKWLGQQMEAWDLSEPQAQPPQPPANGEQAVDLTIPQS